MLISCTILCLFYGILGAYGSKYGDKKLNEWTWITAHNANLNWEDSETIDSASNQKYGIDKQLKFGVRGFMLDISWRKCSPFEKFINACPCEGVCLCHGECDGVMLKDGFNTKPYSYALKKIVKFLKKNPEEIIFLFLEDYIDSSSKLTSIYNSINGLTNMTFNPKDPKWDVPNKGWPKIADMVKANKRLLIIDDEKGAFHADIIPYVIRSRDFILQNHFEWFKDPFAWSVTINNTNGTFVQNRTVLLSRCFSVHNVNRKPMWGPKTELNLTIREHRNQPLNGQKLFLLNHFYGVAIAQIVIDPLTLQLMNTKEFILARLKYRCNPGINNVRPTFIALDFIDSSQVEHILSAFNTKNTTISKLQ